MYQLKRRGPVGYEDLLREMEAIEQQLLSENSSLAMNLMVLEARVRERFQVYDFQTQGAPLFDGFLEDKPEQDDIRSLIPKELSYFPTESQMAIRRRRKKTIETAGMAALLALATALGVFGLASMLQMLLTWVA